MARNKEKMYRVTLVFPFSVTRSVFVKGKNRTNAEKRALRKYPTAVSIDRSPFPQG